jgi:site-specific DNA recombinase
LTRPALTQLLADIGHGLIDAVVVYKVVRLTRALADLRAWSNRSTPASVSFVAVTHQFNTTTVDRGGSDGSWWLD